MLTSYVPAGRRLLLCRRICFITCLLLSAICTNAQVWPVKKAKTWYAQQGWLTGANYLPATAINQLEMFQAATFDTATISKELALAQGIGFNTLRVFLHDKLWEQDAPGFKQRLAVFLTICNRYGIKPILVFFDSCWDPFPKTGKQHEPVPGLHNSGWVQSPGADLLKNRDAWGALELYVKDIVKTFAKDKRILCWDVWNEPDNINKPDIIRDPENFETGSYGILEPSNKPALVAELLPKVFEWVRSQQPEQPLTSGVWIYYAQNWNKSYSAMLSPVAKIQLDNSDIISFHSYTSPPVFKAMVLDLQTWGRPLICTEYMARGEYNTVRTIMPIGKEYNVGLVNWGFVDGREQTKFPWNSWKRPYSGDPVLWHHVLFNADHSPYIPEEIEFIKSLRK